MLQKLKQLFSKVKSFILGIFNAPDANYIADEHFVNHRRHIQAHIDALRGVYTVPESGLYQVSASFTKADKAPKKKKKKSKKKTKKKTKRSSK